MMTKRTNKKFLLLILLVILVSTSIYGQNEKDRVKGNLIQFNDNGFWCWYQDERAIIDEDNGKIIIGSDASGSGSGGTSRNGAVEAVIFDIETATPKRYKLASMGCDDHNAPGFIIRPDGKYLAMYSAHYDYYKNRYRVFDGASWSAEQGYDWTTRSGGTNYTIAYNNVYYLSAEDRMYDFSRANNRSPNFIISDDWGDSWTWGGQLTTNSSDSYNKGYYKYWSNGVDRIDFIFTEQHPRDTLTSIYHGYISNGKAYDSNDKLVDADIFDTSFIPTFQNFTKVFSSGTIIGSDTLCRCWQADLVRYTDSTIATIITARTSFCDVGGYSTDPTINPQHAFVYCRFEGEEWSYTYLCKAGYKFYSSEADYVGLGALCPDDPNTLYLSTHFDPRDESIDLGVREIFKGVTVDSGASWTWTPITENSTRDNLRPIVPAWNTDQTVLLWCRGTYLSAQSFDAAIVGIIESDQDSTDLMHYVDANGDNTTFSTGMTLYTTGPDANRGPADNQWHERTGYGNSGNVLTSAELSGEDAPVLATHLEVAEYGVYDVWVNFWANPDYDWRIRAGLSNNDMQLFRQMACKQVENGDHDSTIILFAASEVFLYQAYLGRIDLSDTLSFNVYLDDDATQIGTTSTLIGNTARTWYDGVSYLNIEKTEIVTISEKPSVPADFTLKQNFPNPFNGTTTIAFYLPEEVRIELTVFNIAGQEVTTLIDKVMNAGEHRVKWNTIDLPTGVYLYRINSDNYSKTMKMMLLK